MKDIKLEQIKKAAQGTAAVYLVKRAHSGAVVGMLEKFRDSRTDTHPWKAFAGYGENRKYIGAFYKEDGGKEAAVAAVAKGVSLTSGLPNYLTFKCSNCGRELPPVSGYERAKWRHCPCGHVAIRKGAQ